MTSLSTPEVESSTELMQAVWYDEKGLAEQVLQSGELPVPIPSPGEVRIRIRASGVNPSDVKSRGGFYTPPKVFSRTIPHSDGAGVIDRVGEGVDQARIGERVWIWNAQWNRASGTAAEYVVLPAEQAVVLPNNVDFAVGATLGVPALTAWRAVTIEGGVAGKILFIAGGAGAVGHFAIQVAKAKGATVITTVSSDEKAAHAHQAGADYILNYRTESVVERVKEITNGKGVDLVVDVDIAANAPILPDIIAPHGTIVVYGTSASDVPLSILRFIVDSVSIRFFIVYELQSIVRQAAISDLTNLLQTGVVTAAIGKHFPLTEIVDAHHAVETGKVIGNVVVDIQ